ncbi:MAG: substrate-binding domain-containing protein [Flavonifractor plautii]
MPQCPAASEKKIPEEVSLFGFDGLVTQMAPTIATVRQDSFRSYRAAELLHKLLGGRFTVPRR